jgi:hypothetical protein
MGVAQSNVSTANALSSLITGLVNITPTEGCTDDQLARLQLMRTYLQGMAEPDTSDTNSERLFELIESASIERLREEFSVIPDVNIPFHDGKTLFIHAVEKKKIEVCRLLIELGADVNKKGRQNNTPLISACYAVDTDICRLILDNGGAASINEYYMDSTAIVVAVNKNQIDIVRLLLERGANIREHGATTLTKTTVLHKAVQNMNLDMCTLLIENGAKMNELDLHDRTPLYYVSQEIDVSGRLMLESLANSFAIPGIQRTMAEKREIREFLIAHGATL